MNIVIAQNYPFFLAFTSVNKLLKKPSSKYDY